MGSAGEPKIIFYTNHRCPCKWPFQKHLQPYLVERLYSLPLSQEMRPGLTNTTRPSAGAHRAQIALSALGLPYTESIVDLDTPRTPEYLKVNPRGLVPSLNYDGAVLTESAIVAQFLADAYPGRLAPASDATGGALARARLAFFADTYLSKAHPLSNKAFGAASAAEAEAFVAEYVAAVKKEVEPLLVGAKPYYGGSETLTIAEVRGRFILPSFHPSTKSHPSVLNGPATDKRTTA